ncbi:MAG: cytochrome b6-f complex subunit PetL [Prochloraceae cyanobacterium]
MSIFAVIGFIGFILLYTAIALGLYFGLRSAKII